MDDVLSGRGRQKSSMTRQKSFGSGQVILAPHLRRHRLSRGRDKIAESQLEYKAWGTQGCSWDGSRPHWARQLQANRSRVKSEGQEAKRAARSKQNGTEETLSHKPGSQLDPHRPDNSCL